MAKPTSTQRPQGIQRLSDISNRLETSARYNGGGGVYVLVNAIFSSNKASRLKSQFRNFGLASPKLSRLSNEQVNPDGHLTTIVNQILTAAQVLKSHVTRLSRAQTIVFARTLETDRS